MFRQSYKRGKWRYNGRAKMFISWCFGFMAKKRKPEFKICDDLWSKLVKIKAGFKCEHCWKTKFLNSHHIFSRVNWATRYDLDNGICLCSWCHTMSQKFSAHRTPMEFAERVIETRGRTRYDNLKAKAKGIRDKDYEKVEKYLIEETNKLTQ